MCFIKLGREHFYIQTYPIINPTQGPMVSVGQMEWDVINPAPYLYFNILQDAHFVFQLLDTPYNELPVFYNRNMNV